jgi:hypothetical protein
MSELSTDPNYEEMQQEASQDELPSVWLRLTDTFFRVRWNLWGPLSDNTSVMKDATDHTSPTEPFVIINPDGSASFHAIANEPVTEPPASTFTVSIDELDEGHDYNTDEGGPPRLVLHSVGRV